MTTLNEPDPITTHALDSTTGLPAPSLRATLTLLSPSRNAFSPSSSNTSSSTPTPSILSFTATTSPNGRITHWTPSPSSTNLKSTPEPSSLREIFARVRSSSKRQMVWSLRFDTLAYFGEGKTFYPEVEVKFLVDIKGERKGEEGDGKEHWHVPVLLGPWGYTTYRGS